jgi:hypothetical protein
MDKTHPPPDDDEGELELEPVDPEILAIERQRAQHRTEAAVGRIDVDELYGDASHHSDLGVDLSGLRQFRFTTRHLLILTAVLAIVLSLYIRLRACMSLFVLGVVAVAGGWIWVWRQERQRDIERARRREEFFSGALPSPTSLEAAEAALEPPARRFDVHFGFSLRELLITMTVAAVAVGLLRWLGPEVLALVLGVVAVVGLVVHFAGFEPPGLVVLGWWLLLVIYLAVGAWLVAAADAKAAGRRVLPDSSQGLAFEAALASSCRGTA